MNEQRMIQHHPQEAVAQLFFGSSSDLAYNRDLINALEEYFAEAALLNQTAEAIFAVERTLQKGSNN